MELISSDQLCLLFKRKLRAENPPRVIPSTVNLQVTSSDATQPEDIKCKET